MVEQRIGPFRRKVVFAEASYIKYLLFWGISLGLIRAGNLFQQRAISVNCAGAYADTLPDK